MNKRIEYIDVAKGITILLVIVGHVEELPPPTQKYYLFLPHADFLFA